MTDCVDRQGAVQLMTGGGDARLLLDPATGLNRYYSAPAPRDVLAYASSTANDIGAAAFARVEEVLAEIGPDPAPALYAARLEAMRGRIRAAYGVSDDVRIVFAPSGTDLEYVALACIAGRSPAGTHTVLLGADEVGSGCIHSAHGLYFAKETALGLATVPGAPVTGLGGVHVDLVDIPVRDRMGRVRPSHYITERMLSSIAAARAASRHSLVHIVHGSKTGLILPSLDDVDRLTKGATLVVDACQARITSQAVNDYLARGAIVFVTGSKFMGGPPFSGFALVPETFAAEAPALPAGLATIFRRAEWPEGWPGAEILPETANIGLLLRLEASMFELERFQALPVDTVERVIRAFHAAVRSQIVDVTAARRVAPYPPGHVEDADTHPIEMRTLSTLDLSALKAGGASFEDAQAWHKTMALAGVRVGQPVKCVRLPDGRWGATLRIGLAMGQVTDAAGLSDAALAARFETDMAAIRDGAARRRLAPAVAGALLRGGAQPAVEIIARQPLHDLLAPGRDEAGRVAPPAGDAVGAGPVRLPAIDKGAIGRAPGLEGGPVHRRAMAGDQRRERRRRDPVQRRAPARRAGRVHERHRPDDEIADDRQPRGGIVEPDVTLGRGMGRQVHLQAATGDGPCAGARDRPGRPQPLGMIHGVEAALDLGTHALRNLPRRERLLGPAAALRRRSRSARPRWHCWRRAARSERRRGSRCCRCCDRGASAC